jgi:hypothetical protein
VNSVGASASMALGPIGRLQAQVKAISPAKKAVQTPRVRRNFIFIP